MEINLKYNFLNTAKLLLFFLNYLKLMCASLHCSPSRSKPDEYLSKYLTVNVAASTVSILAQPIIAFQFFICYAT